MNSPLLKKVFMALFLNIVPLCGVVFFHWSVFSLLLSYWVENVVVGIFQFLKMRRVEVNFPTNERNKLTFGTLRAVTSIERMFYSLFFSFHYGFFLVIHFVFLWIFSHQFHDALVFTPFFIAAAIPFFIHYAKLYHEEFLSKKQYQTVPLAKLFIAPYRRIFVLHLILIVGTVPVLFFFDRIPQITVLLVLLKIALDVVLEEKEFAFWKKLEAKQ